MPGTGQQVCGGNGGGGCVSLFSLSFDQAKQYWEIRPECLWQSFLQTWKDLCMALVISFYQTVEPCEQ